MLLLLLLLFRTGISSPIENADVDGETSRKVIGSSVVTSVSVIMDTGNGTKAIYTDAAGKPMSKPVTASDLASPIDLLNPDRYEFYTFDDNGDLVKRLMTWDEIQGIIASGDGEGLSSEDFTAQGYIPEKKVNDVVHNVQNVLKEEIESHKDASIDHSALFDTPDVSETWSMILPAIFGNSGETIKPEKPIMHGTPDTIMIEPTQQTTTSLHTRIQTTTERIKQETVTKPTTLLPMIQIATSKPITTTKTRKPITTHKTKPPGTSVPLKTTGKPYVHQEIKVTSQRPQQTVTLATEVTSQTSFATQTRDSVKINVSVHSPSESSILRQPIYDQMSLSSSTTYDVKPITSQQPNLIPSSTISHLSTTRFSTTRKPTISSTVRSISSSTSKPISFSQAFTKPPSTLETQKPYSLTTKLPSRKTSTTPRTTQHPVAYSSKTTSTAPVTTLKVIQTTIPPLKATVSSSAEEIRPAANTITTASYESRPTENDQSKNPEISLPTLADILKNNYKPITDSDKPANKEEVNVTTSLPESTTYGSFVTFFSVVDNKQTQPPITEFPTTIDSNLSETKTTLYKEFEESSTEAADSPATTLQQIGKLNYETSTKELDTSTSSELITDETTNFVAKVSATEILDQLLLTPNNIYEINSQFSQKPVEYAPTEGVAEEPERATTTVESLLSTSEEIKFTTSVTDSPTKVEISTKTETPASTEIAMKPENVTRTGPPAATESSTRIESSTMTQRPTETDSPTRLYGPSITESPTKTESHTRTEKPTRTESPTRIESHTRTESPTRTESHTRTESPTRITDDSIKTDTPTTTDSYTTTEIPAVTETSTRKQSSTTTDRNLIESIEKLISQATSNIDVSSLNATGMVEVVSDIVSDTNNKTMTQFQSETATLASSLLASVAPKIVTTTTPEPSLMDETDILSDSVGSILSQIVGFEQASLTTIEDTTTEKYTTPRLEFRTAEIMTEISTIETTKKSEDDFTTTSLSVSNETESELDYTTRTVTVKLDEEDYLKTIGTTEETIDYLSTTEATTDTYANTEDSEPHIINITIISSNHRKNTSKPAKSDTSLEEPYKNVELLKNSSVVNNETITLVSELLQSEASSSLQTNSLSDNAEAGDFKYYNRTKDIATTENSHYYEIQSTTNQEIATETETDNKISTTVLNPGITKFVASSTNPQVTTEIPSQDIEQTTINDANAEVPSLAVKIEENIPNKTADEDSDSSWAPVSTISPHSEKPALSDINYRPKYPLADSSKPVDLVPKPLQGFGLEDTTAKLDNDIFQFAQLCNELAFGFWKSVTNGISQARSVIVSPFAATSLLAMVFLGARGATSGEMNEILKLDDMVTFNPHLIFKNVTESIDVSHEAGVAASAIVRELYSDRSKAKLLSFYKERARQFYDGHVEEVSFREIGDVIRRRTNLLVKKQTDGKITEFLKDNSIIAKAPLAAVSASIFQTDCSHGSTIGRDGELHFVVLPSIRQRRLVPIPAVVYRSNFLAGYEPSLDATAVALGSKGQSTSTIFIMPGQQGIAAPGDGLVRLEKRLVESSFKKGAWSRLLRSLIPRPGLEIQLPRFSHRSVVNATVALKRMGLKDLFDIDRADLRGLNGVANELHLSDMLQINNFATCGENRIGDAHHSELYPATALRSFRRHRILARYRSDGLLSFTGNGGDESKDYQRAFHDPLHDPTNYKIPLNLRPRQARIPETPRLRFNRPFLYVVRHNPTGLILHMGRFNPRLLP